MRRPARAALLALLALAEGSGPAPAGAPGGTVSDPAGPLDCAWDFNTPGRLPPGFAAELGEPPEVVRALLAQAVGADTAPPAFDTAEAPVDPVRLP